VTDIVERLRAGRNAVLEEAAKVADEHAKFCHKEAHSGGDFQHLVARRDEANYLAQRIRSLKQESPARESEG